VDISGKQLELLKVFLPTLSRIAVLLNPGNAANPAVLKHVQAVAPALSIVAVNAGHAASNRERLCRRGTAKRRRCHRRR
jgi:ABC-type uncharacterized transport system substrate-binding protein